MFSTGELDRQIALQSATTSNDPEYNSVEKTWATYATVWAKMEFHRATEGEGQSREYADQGLYFTIRWRSGVDPEHRIVFEGANYEIIGRPREIGRRQGLKMQARRLE